MTSFAPPLVIVPTLASSSPQRTRRIPPPIFTDQPSLPSTASVTTTTTDSLPLRPTRSNRRPSYSSTPSIRPSIIDPKFLKRHAARIVRTARSARPQHVIPRIPFIEPIIPSVPPRPTLQPRSAVANYFNLDFSFLDDEGSSSRSGPPAPSTFPPTRPPQHASRRSIASMRSIMSNRDDDTNTAPPSSRSSKLTFPSRPNKSRTSSYCIADLTPTQLPPIAPSGRKEGAGRKERGSSIHSISSQSSSEAVIRQGARIHLDHHHRENSSEIVSGAESNGSKITKEGRRMAEEEKRSRLAHFLDETATMMEGGKSLAMVLPSTTAEINDGNGLLTLAAMSEATGGSPQRLSMVLTNRFPSQPLSPLISASPCSSHSRSVASLSPSPPKSSATSPRLLAKSPQQKSTPPIVDVSPQILSMPGSFLRSPESVAMDRHHPSTSSCDTFALASSASLRSTQINLYHTSPSTSPTLSSEIEEGLSERERESNGEMGLGLDEVDFTPLQSSSATTTAMSLTSPSTIRPDSPTTTTVREVEVEVSNKVIAIDDKVVEAKRAEKRRRTINELLETEASYATDMAVVRDIYLARARGVDLMEISDHVMSTGLGLSATSTQTLIPLHEKDDDINLSSSRSSTKSPRRSLSALPWKVTPQALMSEQELHVVFANLEEIAGLAETFAGILDDARGSGKADAEDDRIGAVFLEMIPRIQQTYSTYCARHHRAIVLLQELEPSLRPHLAECKTLSHGRTNAWDLASLLIKPVQRCLKYPLLLDQLLALTPRHHPDRANLERANADILLVAEHINEVKKRQDLVRRTRPNTKARIPPPVRLSDSSKRSSSSVKKFLRSSSSSLSQKGKEIDPDGFDTLTGLVDSSRSSVLAFSSEMREYSLKIRVALETHLKMITDEQGVYSVIEGSEGTGRGGHRERLSNFIEKVLRPILQETWTAFDNEIRTSLLVKSEHLLSLFENPRQVIARRNDKMLDHSRYLGSKSAMDRAGSQEFVILSAQLLEELPRFLGSVSRYFNIIVAHFGKAQTKYQERVQERWNEFAKTYSIRMTPYEAIESGFLEHRSPAEEMMHNLATQLGVRSPNPSPDIGRTNVPFSSSSRHRQPSSQSSVSFTLSEKLSSSPRTSNDFSQPRTSVSSASSSAPSFVFSTSAHESISVTTPPSPFRRSNEDYSDVITQSISNPNSSCVVGRRSRGSSLYFTHASRPGSTSTSRKPAEAVVIVERPTSVYSMAEYSFDDGHRASVYENAQEYEDENELGEEEEEEAEVLYVATAMKTTQHDRLLYRLGRPVLNFIAGELFSVMREEADSVEGGGSGWLYGRKHESGQLGYSRTELLFIVEP